MAQKKEYEEVEGIKCEVKDPSRRGVVKFYQQSLRPEIDKYIANNRMTESKRAYADALEVNIKIAPFVLGWLRKPEDEDEYRVIKGLMTIEELEAKRKKEATKNKKTTRARKPKNSTTAKPKTSTNTTKKAAPKKTAPKTPPKKK